MPCDMCGADSQLVLAEIEGVRLQVCITCARFGKVLKMVPKPEPEVKRKAAAKGAEKPEVIAAPPEPEWVLVKDFAERIREKRESLGLKQKEFALKIAEKESLLHKIETGGFTPGIDLARKIERILNITILEKTEQFEAELPKAKDSGLTLGDIIAVKKK